MEIWTSKLIVGFNQESKSVQKWFEHKKQEQDFKLVNNFPKEWVNSDGMWSTIRLYEEINIENVHGNHIAIKSTDKKPTKQEIQLIEEELTKETIKYLTKEKENQIKFFDDRIEILEKKNK